MNVMKIGTKLNKLTLLREFKKPKQRHLSVEVLCECGNIVVVNKYHWTHGKTKSCGCLAQEKCKEAQRLQVAQVIAENLSYVGVKKNKLTAVAFFKQDKSKCWYVKTLCDCGKERVTTKHCWVSGYVTSCGHDHKPKISPVRKNFGESSRRAVFTSYRRSAKQRGRSFEITEEEFALITQQNCYYCGCAPSKTKSKPGHFYGTFTYNGIDRLNNEEGYTSTNTVPCCWLCNKMKSTLSEEQFVAQAQKISAHRV